MNEQTPRRGRDEVGSSSSPALPLTADAGSDGTFDDTSTDSPVSTTALALVQEATLALREQRDPRWVEISDRVLAGALRATRRSNLIRAQGTSGVVHVSEQVLITYIRDAVQVAVPDAALLHVRTDLVGRDTLVGVTLSLVARYGVELLAVADEIRRLTAACLVEVLGPVEVPVGVDLLHVHFSDVVVGDPPHADPWT